MKATEIEQKKQWALQNRLYRLAKKKGLRLEKYRKLKTNDPDYKTYRILSRTSGQVAHATRTGGYGLTLEQVEDYLNRQSAAANTAKLQTVESTAEPKGPGERNTNDLQHSPTVPVAQSTISASETPPEEFITIADAKIPSHIADIYRAIKAFVEAKLTHNDKVVTDRERALLGKYWDAYWSVGNCTDRKKCIYMFAHLLGAAKAL